jgi:hypothetical protein
MSPSPTGPGSSTLASTHEGRETSRERTCPGLNALTKVLAQALQLPGLARSADGGKPQRCEASWPLIETAEGKAWTTISCRKSEIELGLPYEQSCAFAFQDRWFASPRCERRG